tara:strand:+ start:132760 stop:133572 length:813 start_codon:yes stop_codon:yes gene_type:complete
MTDLYIIIACCLPLGVVAGFLAGLFGIGGGAIIVPALYYLFTVLDFDSSSTMHLAIGTSLATIIPTAMSSSYVHYRHGAIDMAWLRLLAFGVVAGAFIGGAVALALSTDTLRRIFAVLLFLMAILTVKKKIEVQGQDPVIKRKIGVFGYGIFSGTISSLIGIGGATLNVPFMAHNGLPLNKAIATASLLGLFVAVPATLVLLFGPCEGCSDGAGLPYSWGRVNILAAGVLVSVSVFSARFGARLTHRMNTAKLKYAFAALMIAVSINMML